MSSNYESSEVRRKQIINAARKLISTSGSDSITVSRIAREVGISEAAIYRHFKSKRDILFSMVEDIEDNLMADLIPEPGVAHQSPLRALDRLLENHFSAIQRRRGVSFLVIAEIVSLGDKKLNKRVLETLQNYIGRLKDILSDGIAAGEIRSDTDLEAVATSLFGMVQATVTIWALSNRSFDPAERCALLWGIYRKALVIGQPCPSNVR
ncbi:MAG: TetR/AcrR family transcriptional regulator [Chloroflexi bacterium]|nr:TetR/AcrR family transcriptional regulator [Chloroflexota bacterium]